MSVFANIPKTEWIAENDLAFAVRDLHPVSLGHTLVITKQIVPNWFDASTDQRQSLFDLVDVVRDQLQKELHVDSFNIGINVGEAAGQTIEHLHIHVIPRILGDVSDPRGGVRHFIPSKGIYPAVSSELFTPEAGKFRKSLVAHLRDPDLDQIDLVVSFIMRSGVLLIRESLEEALQRGARVRILTTDYLMTTDPSALGLLLDLQQTEEYGINLLIKVFSDHSTSFHPKAYLFRSSRSNRRLAFVGSSNLSKSALTGGIEWNLYRQDVDELWAEFETLWNDPRAITLSRNWLGAYTSLREDHRSTNELPAGDSITGETTELAPKPWSIQQEALDALTESRANGHTAGLVVMATGLGKTWLAAFDSSRPSFKRVLFIAHRIEILKAARDVFRHVRVADQMTMYAGNSRDSTGKVVFGGVQLVRQDLSSFDPHEFDYLIVDEFHHATAPTYREIIEYFTPRFLLGLTATPDRSDHADLLALCQDNLVYECALTDGLERGLLSPFKYRAIKDVANYEHIPWKSGRFQVEQLTENLATHERAGQVLSEWLKLGGPVRRTLAFCCSQYHADFMSTFFAERGFDAASVHSGPSSDSREDALADLEAGDIRIIFSVDLFNEGIDVPEIDCVLMLRPTESSVVFFQQLGRGLRKAVNKSHLDVLDLVGNHHSFLSKVRFLVQLSGSPTAKVKDVLDDLGNGTLELPAGCSINFETEALEIMKALAEKTLRGQAVQQSLRSWIEDHQSERPSALQFSLFRGTELGTSKRIGGWFGLLASESLLSSEEEAVYERFANWFAYLEFGAYSKSYKLITVLAFCNLGGFAKSVDAFSLFEACRRRIFGDPRLLADLEDSTSFFVDVLNPTEVEWSRYWRTNPISALTTSTLGEEPWMLLQHEQVTFALPIPENLVSVLSSMTVEICEYRLHRYVAGRRSAKLFPRLQARSADGSLLNAGFRVESQFGKPIAISIDASGGGRNADYVRCIDLVLERLRALGARITDAFVDSSRVEQLPLSSRRLIELPSDGSIRLSDIDTEALRKAMLNQMKLVGRATSAKKSSGNSRKTFKIVIDGVESISAPDLSAFLVNGGTTILHRYSSA